MEGPNSNSNSYSLYDENLFKIEESKSIIETCIKENSSIYWLFLDPKIHLIALVMNAELLNNWEKAMDMQQQFK